MSGIADRLHWIRQRIEQHRATKLERVQKKARAEEVRRGHIRGDHSHTSRR